MWLERSKTRRWHISSHGIRVNTESLKEMEERVQRRGVRSAGSPACLWPYRTGGRRGSVALGGAAGEQSPEGEERQQVKGSLADPGPYKSRGTVGGRGGLEWDHRRWRTGLGD